MTKRLTIEEMHSLAESRGGKCLSTVYVGSQSKLEWECAHGHSWSATPSNIKNHGTWCRICTKITIEDMQALAEEQGGKCISTEYVNSETHLEWKCSNDDHPSWLATPHSVKNKGSWCKKCAYENRYPA